MNNVYNSHIDQNTLEEKYITQKRSIIIAQVCNRLVGCTFLEIQEDYVRPGRILYVTYVAVDEKHRKYGIGKILLSEAEKICKEARCSAIELTSADFRTGAHAFYETLGFTRKKTTVFIKEI